MAPEIGLAIAQMAFLGSDQLIIGLRKKDTDTVGRALVLIKVADGSRLCSCGDRSVVSMALDAAGKVAFVGSDDGIVHAVNLDTMKTIWSVGEHAALPRVLSFNGDALLACLDENGFLRVWETTTRKRRSLCPVTLCAGTGCCIFAKRQDVSILER